MGVFFPTSSGIHHDKGRCTEFFSNYTPQFLIDNVYLRFKFKNSLFYYTIVFIMLILVACVNYVILMSLNSDGIKCTAERVFREEIFVPCRNFLIWHCDHSAGLLPFIVH